MQLTRLNEERREIEQRMQIEATELAARVRFADGGGETLGLCLFDETWHQGVVGLVAGRIKDRLHRPVFAFARASEEGVLKGSGRSIKPYTGRTKGRSCDLNSSELAQASSD